MLIGIIGAGNVAQTFARFGVAGGHEVILSNSGDPDALRAVVQKLGARARTGSVADAAVTQIVVLAVPWPRVESALRGLPAWNGRILIDATNGFRDGTPAGGLVDVRNGSTSEIVAALAPGARVIKTFNTSGMPQLVTPPPALGLKRVLFVSGDDAEAKGVVAGLLRDFGFATVDLGDLQAGGRLQQVGGPIAGREFFVAE
jgi:8-hydroxy-5-deazaflavin:NADPH oxidoreductase